MAVGIAGSDCWGVSRRDLAARSRLRDGPPAIWFLKAALRPHSHASGRPDGVYAANYIAQRYCKAAVGKWRVARQQSKTSGGWRRAVLAAFAGDWRNAVQALDGISIEPHRQLDRVLITARYLVQSGDGKALTALVDQIGAEHPDLLPELQVSVARWQIEGAFVEAIDRLGCAPLHAMGRPLCWS